MNKLDLTCPRCAAIMLPDAKGESASCEYCGHKMVIEKRETAEQIQQKVQAKAYGYHAGKYKAEEEAQKKVRKRNFLGGMIALFVFLVIGFAGIAITFFGTPVLDDPFTYLAVSFEGEDGDGDLVMKVVNNAPGGIDMSRVSFSCNTRTNLEEGQTIVITASSSEYRLGIKSKHYTVEGLDCYVKDVNALTDEQLEAIFESNIAEQTYNTNMVLKDGEELNTKPIRLVCYSKGTENELYLISEVKFAIKNKTYYTVTKWSNVIENRANGMLDLSLSMYEGDLVIVKSFYCASIYEKLESAENAVAEHQESSYEVTTRDFE